MQFLPFQYITDRGERDNVAVLTQKGAIQFQSHFLSIFRGNRLNGVYSAFAISQDLRYLVMCSRSAEKAGEVVFKVPGDRSLKAKARGLLNRLERVDGDGRLVGEEETGSVYHRVELFGLDLEKKKSFKFESFIEFELASWMKKGIKSDEIVQKLRKFLKKMKKLNFLNIFFGLF